MRHTLLSRAIAALLFVLPSFARARVRYTDAAACLASLTQVGQSATGDDTTKNLIALRKLTRAHLAQIPLDDPARADLVRRQSDIERIAANPNYDNRGGFVRTDVVKGRDAILAYADRLAEVATDIDGGALERQGADQFRLGRVLAASVLPLVATGLYAALLYTVFGRPDYTIGHAAMTVPFGAVWAGVMFSQLPDVVGRWRAYLTPARRRAWLTSRDQEPLSDHFANFKDPATAYTEFAFDARVATNEVRQMREDPARAAVTLAEGTRDLPLESTRLSIENIVFVDPQTDEAYAVVHVRGTYLGKIEKAPVSKSSKAKGPRRPKKRTPRR